MVKTGFSVNVTLNHAKIKELKEAQTRALIQTGEKLLAEKIEAKQIPFDEGTLQNVMTYVDKTEAQNGHLAIVSNTPYAARLYFHPEYHFSKQFNPNARGEWWEPEISGDRKDRPENLFKHYYKKESGGIIQ